MTLVTEFIPVASLFIIFNIIGVAKLSFENKMVVKERMNSETLEREISETSYQKHRKRNAVQMSVRYFTFKGEMKAL